MFFINHDAQKLDLKILISMSCDAIIIWQVGTTNLPLPHGLLTMEQSDSTERLGLPRKKIMGGLF